MLNADGTVFGRFGTRSHRKEWYGDVSLPGMAKSLKGALDLHQVYPGNRALVEGKRGSALEGPRPELFPSLHDRFTESLDIAVMLQRVVFIVIRSVLRFGNFIGNRKRGFHKMCFFPIHIPR